MRTRYQKSICAVTFSLLGAYACLAQDKPADGAQAPAAPAASAALPTPAITGPLASQPPASLDGGPFGHIYVNGILTGMGSWSGNYIPGDSSTQSALSNGQV